jgi:hypothetical protein
MLFGIIFFVPIFGLVVGVVMGSLIGSMANVGINDDFIKSVRSKVTEGTSALFLLTTERDIYAIERTQTRHYSFPGVIDAADRSEPAFSEPRAPNRMLPTFCSLYLMIQVLDNLGAMAALSKHPTLLSETLLQHDYL